MTDNCNTFTGTGSDPTHKAIVTKTGNGQRLMVIKSPEGRAEEWKFAFSDCGLVLVRSQALNASIGLWGQQLISLKARPENTHNRGKCHCMADLLFDWFGFDRTIKTVVHST